MLSARDTVEHQYKLRYQLNVESGKFTKKDADEQTGLADALIIGSVLYPEDGSYLVVWKSNDGRASGQPLSSNEQWKAWMVLASKLAEAAELEEWMRDECEKTMDNIRLRLAAEDRK